MVRNHQAGEGASRSTFMAPRPVDGCQRSRRKRFKWNSKRNCSDTDRSISGRMAKH